MQVGWLVDVCNKLVYDCVISTMEGFPGILLIGTLGWLWFALVLFGTIVGLMGTVLWIWMLVEVLTRETDENNSRLVWALVIVFTHWLGALIYLFARRPDRVKQQGR
ncbi:MAG: PLD nuclease N-terminal domain-containing protein [bacterium]